MKYFVVSDIHSEYKRLLEALDAAGFNPEQDTLVVAGDAFDRGQYPIETLKFIMSTCKYHICVAGNHDLDLKSLWYHMSVSGRVNRNGTLATAWAFWYKADDATVRLLEQYFRELIPSVEINDAARGKVLIVHGWAAHETLDWTDATWVNTKQILAELSHEQANPCIPEVDTLIIGHWWSWDLRGATEPDDCAPFEAVYPNRAGKPTTILGIDGMTNYPAGRVNVVVLEGDEVAF